MKRALQLAVIAAVAILTGRLAFAQPALKQLNDELVQLAKNATPSVVDIEFPGGPAGPKIFRKQVGGGNAGAEVEIRIEGEPGEGAPIRGSGVIMTSDGFILTSADHLRGAAGAKVKVTLSDGRALEGSLVGRDLRTGLAVVKVDARDLPAVTLAEESPPVGSLVVAVGDTAGLGTSVSLGVVAGAKRTVTGAGAAGIGSSTQYPDLLQITNPVTPSDVGGLALDLNGKMIGILHSSMTGRPLVAREMGQPGAAPGVQVFGLAFGGAPTVQGVSFATPVEAVNRVFDSLREGEKVQWGFLGLYYNITRDKGLVVTKLVPQSPAQAAGLKEGDVITSLAVPGLETLKFTGVPGDVPVFGQRIGWARPETEVTLGLIRGGVAQELKVKLGTAPEMPDRDLQVFEMEPNARPFPDEEMNPFMRRPWLGVQLEPGDAGPRVAAVMPMSPAQRHGLRVGDILTKVGGKDVRAAEDVTKEIEQHKPGERVSLTLQRGNEQIVAEVELGLQPGRPGAPLNVFRMPGEQRSYLGIEAKDAQDGLKITKVFEGSPADKAGLKCDDVILRVDDRDVAGLNDLRAIVRAHKPDDEITIAVKRLDRELDVKVKLGRIGDANWNALP